jgi:23S rRNA pseudouridine1911/1915/1917 synthase
LRILFEDNHLLAVQKLAGVPVQGDETGDTPLTQLVEDYLRHTYNKPGNIYVGLVHRLDRPVSGVVLFAKTGKAAARLSEIFREHQIEKVYLAIVERRPPREEDTLKGYIWKDPKANRVYLYEKEKKGSKYAELHYRLLAEREGMYLLAVWPKTGRSHQIRAQLANMGCTILGDTKYGSRLPLNDRSISLLAWQLSLTHPVRKEPLTIRAEAPASKWWRLFDLENLSF